MQKVIISRQQESHIDMYLYFASEYIIETSAVIRSTIHLQLDHLSSQQFTLTPLNQTLSEVKRQTTYEITVQELLFACCFLGVNVHWYSV